MAPSASQRVHSQVAEAAGLAADGDELSNDAEPISAPP